MAASIQLLAHISLGAFCVSSLIVGARLLRLHFRTGQRPELLAAVALICIGPLGFVLSIACVPMDVAIPGLGVAAWALASLAIAVGTTAAFAFTRSVFYAGSAAVGALCRAAVLVLAVCLVGEGFATGFHTDGAASGFTRVADWVRTAGLLFGGFASMTEFRNARRRLSLGLAEPAVALRFGLWGIGLLCVGFVGVIDSTVKLSGFTHPGINLLGACAGLLAAIAVHLAFHRGSGAVARRLEDLLGLRSIGSPG